jgi:hypothetical protein
LIVAHEKHYAFVDAVKLSLKQAMAKSMPFRMTR